MPRWKQERNRRHSPRRDGYVPPTLGPLRAVVVSPPPTISVPPGTLPVASMRVVGRALGSALRQYGLPGARVTIDTAGGGATYHVEFSMIVNSQTAALVQEVGNASQR